MKKIAIFSFFGLALLAINIFGEHPVMSSGDYVDYAVQYHCAEQKFHNDPQKMEVELAKMDKEFHLTDENFDEIDRLISKYEQDPNLRVEVEEEIESECGVSQA